MNTKRPLPSQKMRLEYARRRREWSENTPEVTITFGDLITDPDASTPRRELADWVIPLHQM